MLIRLSERQERIMELILVLSLAVLPVFLNALFTYFGHIKFDYSASSLQVIYILQIIQQVLVILVFFYVLYRQGRGFDYIGLSFSWRDIFRGLALLFIAYGFIIIINIVIGIFSQLSGEEISRLPENIDMFSKGPISLALIILLVVNSLYEELIVRAYLITEVKEISRNAVLAVTLCVIIQTSYHIYQGLIPLLTIAGTFLVFSVYYIRKKRIMPVILAHTYMNMISAIASRYIQ